MNSAQGRKSHESCLVRIEERYYMTDTQGRIVKEPAWEIPPLLYSVLFFKHEDAYWGMEGSKLDCIVGDVIRFAHMWLCQRIADTLFIGRIVYRDQCFHLDNNMIIEKLGFCDYDNVIVLQGGKWRKYFYVDGYHELDNFNLHLVTKRDFEIYHRFGATTELLTAIVSASGMPMGTVVGRDDADVYGELADLYRSIIELCFQGLSPEEVTAATQAPLDVVYRVKACLGDRSQYTNW